MSHRNAMIASVAFVLVLLAGIVTLRDRLTTSADIAPTTSPLITAVPTGVAVAESGDLPATDAVLPETNAWTNEESENDESEHRSANPAATRTPYPDRQHHEEDEENDD